MSRAADNAGRKYEGGSLRTTTMNRVAFKAGNSASWSPIMNLMSQRLCPKNKHSDQVVEPRAAELALTMESVAEYRVCAPQWIKVKNI
jgi:hypothetical protein